MNKARAATAAAVCCVAFAGVVPSVAAQTPPSTSQGVATSDTLKGVAAPVVPRDDEFQVDFYGSLRLGMDYVDAGTPDDAINGRDFLSRVGINARKRIGDGVALVGTVEYGLRSDNLVDLQQNGDPTLRLGYVGLQSEKYGSLYYGSQSMVFHRFVRGSYFGDGLDSVRLGSIRDDDMLQYYYSTGNLTVGAAVQSERQDGDSLDQFQLGAEYDFKIAKLQVAAIKDNQGINTGTLWGVRGWIYPVDGVTLSAYRHQQTEDFDIYRGSTGTIRLRDAETEGRVDGIPNCPGQSRSATGVYASYRTGGNQIHGRFAVDSCDVSGNVKSYKIEYMRHLSKDARLWVGYETLDNDPLRAPASSSGDSMSQVELGVRYDF
ncbi:porin [Altererythrobacter endophyticus]|uniref:Porin n=2 Tax=Altericroceibacterium endophyticum TaxID=1808508 RepID=A0A6I4T531_9SPHN|nr:porin [Altericroceibacterium endophyticum]